MQITVFGASGNVGQRIVQEALRRGHDVKAVVRNPHRIEESNPHLQVVKGDASDAADVAKVVAGSDVVVSAISARTPSSKSLAETAQALIEGLKQAGGRRLIVVGGAGTLEIEPGLQLVDTPEFPAAYKGESLDQRDALAVYSKSDLDWTYLSPAAVILPGARTGKYRTGTTKLLYDERGESEISIEDYAVALLDEIEKPHFIRQQFTVAN